MRMFFECGYSERISALIFLLFDIMSLLYLNYRLISEKREKRRIIVNSFLFLGTVLLYCILQNDHIPPLDAEVWKGPEAPLPMMSIWFMCVILLIYTSVLMNHFEVCVRCLNI